MSWSKEKVFKNLFSLLFLFFLFINFSLPLFADAHIFVYHRFGDDRYPSTNTSIEQLRKDFEYLKTNGYEVIPLSRLTDAVKNSENIPDKWVVITIDDGYKSFYQNALYIFKEYGYHFTLFAATKPSLKGYKDFMRWEELKEASKYGDIGLHSHSHPHLTHLSDEEIKKDTKTGIDLFEKYLGFRPNFYAYPYGEYDERVKNIIKSFGFKAICNQNAGAINKTSDIYDLDRIALVGKSDISSKLKLRYLNALWIEPRNYPANGILEKVKVKIFDNAETAEIYVTGYGWKRVKVKNGLIDEEMNLHLKKKRTRVIIKVKNSKISTRILVK
ncbi:polysaccharide deacetylase family protein [Nitrosophilus alvini]|uniref:polysaccharide deacetylase family protein n=1 Tax=Nitrosophilus alvini TaxID=2714855 RepID=UPI00190C16AA|nr:polysaccharide deacetylase family protein [Nitrosophilus alvini]